VKIQGKDVVASYKVLSAIVIVPISVVIYTLMFYYFAAQYHPSDDAFWLSVLFFFLWPVYVSGIKYCWN